MKYLDVAKAVVAYVARRILGDIQRLQHRDAEDVAQVAAMLDAAVREAVAEEREACAKVAEETGYDDEQAVCTARRIRQRGKT